MLLSVSETARAEAEPWKLLADWNVNILQPYSKAKLTRQSDKIVAFSGLTEQFASITGWKSAWGLWMPFLAEQCLWFVPPNSAPSTRLDEFPSWSWTSLATEIDISDPSTLLIASFFKAALSTDYHQADSHPTGLAVTETAVLNIKSCMIPVAEIDESERLLHRKYPRSRIQVPGYSNYYAYPEFTGRPDTRFYPDTRKGTYVGCFFVPVLAVEQTVLSTRHVMGLVVCTSRKIPGAYERVGLLELDLDDCKRELFFRQLKEKVPPIRII
jgi:hypothetical protein